MPCHSIAFKPKPENTIMTEKIQTANLPGFPPLRLVVRDSRAWIFLEDAHQGLGLEWPGAIGQFQPEVQPTTQAMDGAGLKSHPLISARDFGSLSRNSPSAHQRGAPAFIFCRWVDLVTFSLSRNGCYPPPSTIDQLTEPPRPNEWESNTQIAIRAYTATTLYTTKDSRSILRLADLGPYVQTHFPSFILSTRRLSTALWSIGLLTSGAHLRGFALRPDAYLITHPAA